MTYLPSSTTTALNSIQSQLNDLKGLLRQYKQGFTGLTTFPGYNDRWFQGNLCVGQNNFMQNNQISEWNHPWMQNQLPESDVLRHYWTAEDVSLPIKVSFPIGESVIYRQWFVRDSEDNQIVNIVINDSPVLVNYNVENHLSKYSWGFRDFKVPIEPMSQGFRLEYSSGNSEPTKMHVFSVFPDN